LTPQVRLGRLFSTMCGHTQSGSSPLPHPDETAMFVVTLSILPR
jgi:hypothetical protein